MTQPKIRDYKTITAIFACYKDDQAIPILYDRVKKVFKNLSYDYEIIFVNDGSPNDDEGVIKTICKNDPKVIGISHSRNFGSQSAFLSGMGAAIGDAVVLMDGDGQDPPEIIPKFIKQWEEGFEVVYGRREKRAAPFYMQIFYKLFYRVFRYMSNINIPVDAGDFSLIDRRVVEKIVSLPEKDVFLRGLRAWVGYKQTGIGYFRPERLFGTSTNNFSKNIWWAKKGLFSFSSKPLIYIQSLGMLAFLISIILAVFYFVSYFINPPPASSRGIVTVILLVLGIGGVQLISLSIVGEYIAKILDEVKSRPKFIRSKIIASENEYLTDQEINDFLKERGSN